MTSLGPHMAWASPGAGLVVEAVAESSPFCSQNSEELAQLLVLQDQRWWTKQL